MGSQSRLSMAAPGTVIASYSEAHEFVSESLAKTLTIHETGGIRGTRSHPAERTRDGTYKVQGTIHYHGSKGLLDLLLPRILGAGSSPTFTLAEKDGLPPKKLDAQALERLKQHRWPGNVRELVNLVRRLSALYSEEVIGVETIEAELADAVSAIEQGSPAGDASSSDVSLADAVDRHLQALFVAHGERLPPDGMYDRVISEVERPLLSLALGATRGNQLRAARLLGLNRNTLRKKIKDLDVPVVRTPQVRRGG
jgi:two-component system nitrogen regulation response regulator GlnG